MDKVCYEIVRYVRLCVIVLCVAVRMSESIYI